MPVLDELKEIGGGSSPSYDFNQASFCGANERVNGVSLAGGYCSGVVLDWARRVLQSSPGRDAAYLNYANEGNYSATLNRMARAYDGHATTYVAESNRVKALARLRELKNFPEENFAFYGMGVEVTHDDVELFSKIWSVPGGPNSAFARFQLNSIPPGALKKTSIDNLINNLLTTPETQNRRRDSQGRLWSQFAAELDERFQTQRRGAGKVAKKLYSNMHVVKSVATKTYNSGWHANIELKNYGFQKECCTIITFMPSGGGTGHAVAVYQIDDIEYYFFDPNYGVFKYRKEQLGLCLQHLFWTPYFAPPTGVIGRIPVLDEDKAVYQRRNRRTDPARDEWNRMGYTIFGVD